MAKPANQVPEDALQRRHAELVRARDNHYDAAREFGNLDIFLSWGSVALTAILGVATIKDLLPLWLFSLLMLTSAALGAVAKSSRLAESAAKHKELGSSYGSLVRLADELIEAKAASKLDDKRRDELLNKFAEADKAAPSLPSHIYHLSRGWRRLRNTAWVLVVVAVISALGYALSRGMGPRALRGAEPSHVEKPAVK